jgi:HlyD family secretion protein
VIYAPISGVVLSRDVEPGQTVAASMQTPVLYTLAQDLRYMVLKVDVDEADVGQVKAGQSADFTVDAYPDRTFSAGITRVKYGAETTDGVVTYETTLKVENPDLLLRPGMTATADITVMNLENVLLLPNAALRFRPAQMAVEKKDRRSVVDALVPRPPHHGSEKKKAVEKSSALGEPKMSQVWVLKEGRPVPVAVKTLATDSAMTAVSSRDLNEGDAVIVRSLSEGR